jgi:hypothetical protein
MHNEKLRKIFVILFIYFIPVPPSGAHGIRETPFHFSFVIIYTVGRTPWAGGHPITSPLPTQENTNRINEHGQTCVE